MRAETARALKMTVLLTICLGITGCVTTEHAMKQASGCKYEVVENWPQVPEGIVVDRWLGVATDSSGKVYVIPVIDGKGNDVFIFAPDGKYLDRWNSDVLKQGHGLRIHNDHVWMTDLEHHQVLEFTLDGKLQRAFGERGNPGESETQFKYPTDIAFAANGDIYVADGYGNSRVVCLSPQGKFKFAWGTRGDKPGEFFMPHNIVIDRRDRVYVVDRGNQRVQVFDAGGRFLSEWVSPARPFGLAVDREQIVYVADGDGHRVMIFNPDGSLLSKFGERGDKPGQFQVPHSIHVDENGNVYVAEVADTGVDAAPRFQKFTRK